MEIAMLQPKLVIVSLSAVLLSACVVTPLPPPRPVVYAPEPVAEAPVIVDVAPPPSQVEVVPLVPFAGALWIGGYWGWNGGRHVWVPGRWEHPRPGYGWRPHAWVQQNGRWHLHAGGWVRM
jgi:WXXGXW repeat (2 copies)